MTSHFLSSIQNKYLISGLFSQRFWCVTFCLLSVIYSTQSYSSEISVKQEQNAKQNCVLGAPVACEVFANLDISVAQPITETDNAEIKVSFTYLFHFPASVVFQLPTARINRNPVLGNSEQLGTMRLTDISNQSVSPTNYGFTLITANFEYTFVWDLMDENQLPAQLFNLFNVSIFGINTQVRQSQFVAHGLEYELGPKKCGSFKGSACSLLNGNYFLQQQDHGQNQGLAFNRYYNSLNKIGAGKDFSAWSSTGSATIINWNLNFDDDPNKELILYIDDMGRYEHLYRNSSSRNFEGESELDFHISKASDGSYQVIFADGRVDKFDAQGKIIARLDSFGNQTRFERSGRRLTKIINKDGRALTLNYTGSQITSITQPDGNNIDYTYDSEGELTSVSYPDGSVVNYGYDDNDFLNQVRRNNNQDVIDNSFDSLGRVLTHTDHLASRSYQFSYQTRLKDGVTEATQLSDYETVTQYTDSLGNSATQVSGFVNQQHRMISYQHTSGEDSDLTKYDDNGNPSSKTDAEGNKSAFNYNEFDQLLLETRGVGSDEAITTKYRYLDDHIDLPTSITKTSVAASNSAQLNNQELNHVVSIDYNSQNKPTKLTESGFDPQGQAISRTTEFSYDAQGNITLIDGARTDVSDVTTIAFNQCSDGAECGQVSSITDAIGRKTQFDSYDNAGRVTKIIYPNGLASEYQYDAKGKVTVITLIADGVSRETRYQYQQGLLTKVTHPSGDTLTFNYDGQENLIQITDSAGHVTRYEYDQNDNQVAEHREDQAGSQYSMQRTFDRLDQVDLLKGINGDQDLDIDKIGRLVKVTDALGRETSTQYDALSRVNKIIDAKQGETLMQYNVQDQVTSVTDALGNTSVYQYDDFGRKLQQLSPSTGSTSYRYDEADNLVAMTDARGVTTDHQYDALNRIIQIDRPNTDEDITFNYDINGQLAKVTHQAGQSDYVYNGFTELTLQQERLGTENYQLAYQYNNNGQLSKLTYPSGDAVIYSYSNNRVAKVEFEHQGQRQVLADAIAYQPFGPIKAVTYGNSRQLNWQYNSNYQLTELEHQQIAVRNYLYDAVDNIINANSDTGLSNSYEYDELTRLTKAQTEQAYREFSYDAIGNRTEQQTEQEQTDYNYNSDSAANGRKSYLSTISNSAETIAINYDEMGNITSKGELSFTYNQAGRLAEFEQAGQTTSYQYNHLGQRAVKVTSLGQTIHYLYNQAGQLTFEQNLDTKESKQYVWLGQQLLALSKNSQQTIPAQEIIIDDTEVNFQGQWVDATPTQYAKYQGEGYHKFKLTKKNQSDTQAQWPFTLSQAGEYEVSVRWPAEFKKQKNATAVFYDITDESGTTRVRKGQNQQRNKWVSLGKFNFVAGQEYQVVLAKGFKKGKFIFADAVKVTPVSTSSQANSGNTEPEVFYAHNNHLNTVTHLSDKDGNVVWQAEYEAFGQAVVLSDSAELDFNLRLPGQYYDKESKLHYNYFRYYDPETGRYTQSDPIGLAGGMNTYAYAGSNPIMHIDPLGLSYYGLPGGLPGQSPNLGGGRNIMSYGGTLKLGSGQFVYNSQSGLKFEYMIGFKFGATGNMCMQIVDTSNTAASKCSKETGASSGKVSVNTPVGGWSVKGNGQACLEIGPVLGAPISVSAPANNLSVPIGG